MTTFCISPCPNDTFAFHQFVGQYWTGRVEYHDIEQLNAMAINALPDVCKISCAVLPLVRDQYQMLDAGAALGFGNGPLLVARKLLTKSELRGKKICNPGPAYHGQQSALEIFS